MPSEVTLTVEPRSTSSSRAVNRLRREGLVPAVVYGRGSSPKSVAVVRRELRAALTTDAGMNAVLNLDVGGERLLAIVREVQRDVRRNEVSHVDFILISRDEAVTVEVPIVLHGEAIAVGQAGGTIEQLMHSLTVSAKPGEIPNEIGLDIGGLQMGDHLRVSDLAMPAGATTDVDPEEAVLVVQVSQAAVEAETLDMEAAEAVALDELAAAGVGEGTDLPPADGGSEG